MVKKSNNERLEWMIIVFVLLVSCLAFFTRICTLKIELKNKTFEAHYWHEDDQKLQASRY